MTPEKPPPGTIPTLTEVVTWPDAPSPAAATPAPSPTLMPASPPAQAETPAAPAAPVLSTAPVQAAAGVDKVTEAELARRVMADLQKQIDLMLDVRLREALAPILARAGDAIVRDARKELTTALRDVVARAVEQELGRIDKP